VEVLGHGGGVVAMARSIGPADTAKVHGDDGGRLSEAKDDLVLLVPVLREPVDQ
jgi:hypothetical protein